jgi:CBS domain containing-hemolysin-like protein
VAGRVPSRSEVIVGPTGLEFEVLDADPRRVKRLRIVQRSIAPENGEAAEISPRPESAAAE